MVWAKVTPDYSYIIHYFFSTKKERILIPEGTETRGSGPDDVQCGVAPLATRIAGGSEVDPEHL